MDNNNRARRAWDRRELTPELRLAWASSLVNAAVANGRDPIGDGFGFVIMMAGPAATDDQLLGLRSAYFAGADRVVTELEAIAATGITARDRQRLRAIWRGLDIYRTAARMMGLRR